MGDNKQSKNGDRNKKGANQFKADPRQALFLSYYLDPDSETFSNATQSALKAGYEPNYADNITAILPKWLGAYIQDNYLVKKAESNLKEFLDSASEKTKADITKFVLERLNKKKYSQKVELGGNLKINSLKDVPTDELENIAGGSEKGAGEEGVSQEKI